MSKIKITLTDSWMFAGTTYLPGEHEVGEELARIFESRQAIPEGTVPAQSAAAAAPATPPVTTGTGTENPPAPSTPPAVDPLVELVGPKAAASLKNAGYGTVEAWRTADDATLLALDHVGDATVKKLREQQG